MLCLIESTCVICLEPKVQTEIVSLRCAHSKYYCLLKFIHALKYIVHENDIHSLKNTLEYFNCVYIVKWFSYFSYIR